MKVTKKLDFVIESTADACEIEATATQILKGHIPWETPCVKLWITMAENESQGMSKLIMASTAMVQRMLFATSNYWHDRFDQIMLGR